MPNRGLNFLTSDNSYEFDLPKEYDSVSDRWTSFMLGGVPRQLTAFPVGRLSRTDILDGREAVEEAASPDGTPVTVYRDVDPPHMLAIVWKLAEAWLGTWVWPTAPSETDTIIKGVRLGTRNGALHVTVAQPLEPAVKVDAYYRDTVTFYRVDDPDRGYLRLRPGARRQGQTVRESHDGRVVEVERGSILGLTVTGVGPAVNSAAVEAQVARVQQSLRQTS